MRKIRSLLFILVLLASVSTADASVRGQKRVGFFGDYNFGTGLLGANIGFNAIDWLRLHLGYAFSPGGGDFDAQIQGGAKFFVPDWDFSPFAGLGSGPSSGTLAVTIGLDYTSAQGINLGIGYSRVSTDGASGTYIYLGYYF